MQLSDVPADPQPLRPDLLNFPSAYEVLFFHCFSCSILPQRQNCRSVTLSARDLARYSSVDTTPIANLFQDLHQDNPATVLLCPFCCSGKRGWPVICNPRKHVSGTATRTMKAWGSRKSSCGKQRAKPNCSICVTLSEMNTSQTPEIKIQTKKGTLGHITRDLTAFEISVLG